MAEPLKPEQFARRVLLLVAQGRGAQEFAAKASEAERFLRMADDKAEEVARDRTFSVITGDIAAEKVVRAYERAEKQAREALAVATRRKREAEAVQDILRRVRHQIDAQKDPPTLT